MVTVTFWLVMPSLMEQVYVVEPTGGVATGFCMLALFRVFAGVQL